MTADHDRLGRPLRDLRVSVTDRCNLRCRYCMPEGRTFEFLPRAEVLSFEEITRLVGLFTNELGVRKVRLTGGEPLLRRDLPVLVQRLGRVQGVRDIALTTNGTLLAEHASALADAGLTRVTVSLDSLDPERFVRAGGTRAHLDDVLHGIDAAEQAGLGPLKLNCVVQRGLNEDDLAPIARFARERGHVARFIEYMDVGTLNDWRTDRVVPATEIVGRLERALGPLEPVARARSSDTAERYRFVDGSGEVGVIASVTRPFCGDCSRARLSADGRLLTCLFAADGTDLRAPLRAGADDATIAAQISSVWQARTDRYSERRHEQRARAPRRRRLEMYQVGG